MVSPGPPIESERFTVAAARFAAFFSELGRTFVERAELLAQTALGLLGREHCLMTGPPGTAKSGVASAVLSRIVDEKSRAPSLFARQSTESTVQTDLVGPINFKTLMETGRTAHFTDEGMLGAVHALLDEVFDGRDMLLRSTLNVLQERELKQGGRTTRGQIECALMTSNRYLAEVLEGSRETLLAFVDRIAFVSFIPKGFGDETSLPRVLKRQLGQGAPFTTDLTIQDLDALQAVVDAVPIPDAVLERLGKLLALFDEELAQTTRSDPQFLPTRYLSTRTAVRLGKLLRAVCVFDRIFFRQDRELTVDHNDIKGLRYSLVLAGRDARQEAVTISLDALGKRIERLTVDPGAIDAPVVRLVRPLLARLSAPPSFVASVLPFRVRRHAEGDRRDDRGDAGCRVGQRPWPARRRDRSPGAAHARRSPLAGALAGGRRRADEAGRGGVDGGPRGRLPDEPALRVAWRMRPADRAVTKGGPP